jgi:hypothetical protein
MNGHRERITSGFSKIYMQEAEEEGFSSPGSMSGLNVHGSPIRWTLTLTGESSGTM